MKNHDTICLVLLILIFIMSCWTVYTLNKRAVMTNAAASQAAAAAEAAAAASAASQAAAAM